MSGPARLGLDRRRRYGAEKRQPHLSLVAGAAPCQTDVERGPAGGRWERDRRLALVAITGEDAAEDAAGFFPVRPRAITEREMQLPAQALDLQGEFSEDPIGPEGLLLEARHHRRQNCELIR